jgi:hypothetical protein
VSSGGINLVENGGLTVSVDGIQVTKVGLTVSHGGLVVTDGMSIPSTGLSTSKLTALNDGMIVSSDGIYGGLTINSGGLHVTGGLSIVRANILGGMSIKDKGMKVNSVGGNYKGGITILSGGLMVSNGLTVYTLGVGLENSPTVFSDRRLKQDIKSIDNSLDIINDLRGILYSWNKEKLTELSLDEKRHIGFIAQDVQDVVPEVVSMMKNGEYLGVNYEEIIPILIESIKELDHRTNEQTYQINTETTTNNKKKNTTNIIEKNYNRLQVINAIDDLKLLITDVEINQNKLI